MLGFVRVSALRLNHFIRNVLAISSHFAVFPLLAANRTSASSMLLVGIFVQGGTFQATWMKNPEET